MIGVVRVRSNETPLLQWFDTEDQVTTEARWHGHCQGMAHAFISVRCQRDINKIVNYTGPYEEQVHAFADKLKEKFAPALHQYRAAPRNSPGRIVDIEAISAEDAADKAGEIAVSGKWPGGLGKAGEDIAIHVWETGPAGVAVDGIAVRFSCTVKIPEDEPVPEDDARVLATKGDKQIIVIGNQAFYRRQANGVALSDIVSKVHVQALLLEWEYNPNSVAFLTRGLK